MISENIIMPEISVIMGVYNQYNRNTLKAAVDSILNQSFKDFEFIIYDDGSNDEAADILKEITKNDSRIRLIGKDQNHGLAFSLNACIRESKGRFIARMDADDVSYPDRLLIQRRFLEENPEYDWVGCNIELFDDNGIWGMRRMPERPTEKDYLRFSPYAHPTVMYRADVFERCAGYECSEEMLRCEDYEIFMRLRSAGLKGANIQECLFAYREDSSSYGKRTLKFRINEAKCRYRSFKKLRILFPFGFIFVLRPLAACIIPKRVLMIIKHLESGSRISRQHGNESESQEVQTEVTKNEDKKAVYIGSDTFCGNVGRMRIG